MQKSCVKETMIKNGFTTEILANKKYLKNSINEDKNKLSNKLRLSTSVLKIRLETLNV